MDLARSGIGDCGCDFVIFLQCEFLRKIVPGGIDDSYGIEVAKLAGIPQRVITRAKELLGEMENQTGYNKTAKASLDQVSFSSISHEEIAEKLGLSSHLILGVGERKGGGRHRASILADVVEAIIGAMYLDSDDGFMVRDKVLLWYDELIDVVGEEKVLKDAKSRLQEWLQGRKLALPIYQLEETIGNAPNQIFVVSCTISVPETLRIQERGESRRIAEQKCAELMINQLNTKVLDCTLKTK